MMDEKYAKVIGSLEAKVELILVEIGELRKGQQALMAMANRWKGGTIVLMAIGGTIGWGMDKVISLVSR
jgi:hypothetical protein